MNKDVEGGLFDDDDGFFRKDLVYENGLCRFYKNSWCLQYESHINKYDENGITLPDRMTVYLCEPKDGGTPSYVAFDTKGKPYMEWTDSFQFDFNVRALKMKIAEEYNLRNLAKKKNDTLPKGVIRKEYPKDGFTVNTYNDIFDKEEEDEQNDSKGSE